MFVKIVYNAYDVVQSKIFWNTGIGFSSKRRREKRGGLDKTRVKDALALVESYCTCERPHTRTWYFAQNSFLVFECA